MIANILSMRQKNKIIKQVKFMKEKVKIMRKKIENVRQKAKL